MVVVEEEESSPRPFPLRYHPSLARAVLTLLLLLHLCGIIPSIFVAFASPPFPSHLPFYIPFPLLSGPEESFVLGEVERGKVQVFLLSSFGPHLSLYSCFRGQRTGKEGSCQKKKGREEAIIIFAPDSSVE